MINCKSGEVLFFDERILDEFLWVNDPDKTLFLLNSSLGETTDETLKKNTIKYLSLIENYPFFLNTEQVAKQNFDIKYILILGKSLHADGTLKKTLTNRLNLALKNYHLYNNSKIIVSGRGKAKNITEAQAMKNWLLHHGVFEKDIILEDESQDTTENILFSTQILIHNCAEEVTLITSEDHIFRASSLMHIYFQENNIKINLKFLASKTDLNDDYFNKNKENFILFKDIGRILGLWDYETNILL